MSNHQETYKNYLNNNRNDEDKDFLDELDISKIILVLKKSAPWIIIIFILGVTGSKLYLRYTHPVYQSNSTIKVKQENEAQEVNLLRSPNQAQNQNDLEGEIELIRSKIVYDQVIKNLNLWVSYFAEGRVLDDEKFPNDIFTITNYEIKNQNLFNSNFYVELINQNTANLTYTLNGELISHQIDVNKRIITPEIEFDINFTNIDNNQFGRRLYFVVNNKPSLYTYLSNNLVAFPNDRSKTITITFSDKNKFKAQKIVNQVDSIYLKLTLDDKQKKNEQSIAYIESQLEKTGNELANYEAVWESFSRENTTNRVDNDFNHFIMVQRQKKASLSQDKLYLESIEKVLANTLQDSLDSSIPIIRYIEDPKLSELSDELIEINNRIKTLLRSRNENSIVVSLKMKEYNEVKQKVVAVLNDLKESIKQLIQDTEKELAEVNLKLETLPRKSTIEAQILRKYDLYEKFYSMLQEKKLEYEIQKAGIVQDFKILSPASLPMDPVSPNRNMIYVYGIVLALTFSLLLIIIRYFLHNELITQNDFERLTKVPILGIVPKHKKKMEVSLLVVHQNPKAAISEAFRSLRTNLEFLSSLSGKKIFSVTSTTSGEGKTFVSTNLSAIIALSGKKVVLLDLDMRKPKVHLAFGMENNEGMSTLLIEKSTIENCVQHTEVKDLDFISAGPIPPNPSELILRDSFDNLLNKLHETYDVIIIDTPPTGLVTDGVLIMKKVDAPLYVARSEYTKKGFERNLNTLYAQNEFKRLAVIINGMAKAGTYGYGYGYGYGNYYEEDQEKSFFQKLFSKN